MKTFITFIAAILTVTAATAQDYYKDGALFKINDDLTFECSVTDITISLKNIKQYTSTSNQENNVARLKDHSAFKKALEETFTSEELKKYKDVLLVMWVTHDASLKPIDVTFSFSREVGNAIPPAKFAKLRQKIMEYAQFQTNIKLNPGEYYSWDEGLIAPIWYYRDAQYLQRGKK